MKAAELQRDYFIDSATGGNISFHSIEWNRASGASTIPTGGNLNYHSIPERGTSLHTHEFAEVILILSGKIRHYVNGESQSLKAGSLVFVRPSDSHCFRPIADEACEMVIFAYQLEALLGLSKFFEDDSFMWKFTEPVLPPCFMLQRTEADELGTRLMNLNDGGIKPVLVTRTKVKVMLAELFAQYFLEDLQSLQEENVPDWLEELCKKMQQPENLIAGLKKMQSLACCTPEHLCKSFRKYLNKTPTEFINELRINYAARQLVDTREEIMAIAMDLNFQSLSRFYHLFKKYYGMAPAKYRKLARSRKKII